MLGNWAECAGNGAARRMVSPREVIGVLIRRATLIGAAAVALAAAFGLGGGVVADTAGPALAPVAAPSTEVNPAPPVGTHCRAPDGTWNPDCTNHHPAGPQTGHPGGHRMGPGMGPGMGMAHGQHGSMYG